MNKYVALGVLCVGGLFIGGIYQLTQMDMIGTEKKVVRQWLNAQMNGEDGKRFWKKDCEPMRLFAIRDYTFLNYNGNWIVRVDSSNAAGFHITKLWRVYVDFRTREIYDLREA